MVYGNRIQTTNYRYFYYWSTEGNINFLTFKEHIMSKILVLLSGGMDSTALAYLLHPQHTIEAISFNYGQKHARELDYAKVTAATLGIAHTVFNIDQIFNQFGSTSALLNDEVEVPEGHYADITMRSTVVPNRNMIMLSLATGLAISKKFDAVAYASHTGDHAVYKDCKPEFFNPLKNAVENSDWHPVTLYAPFINISKSDIAAIGNVLHVPWENTYSCYNGQEIQCGVCGTCTERLEALEEAKTINAYDVLHRIAYYLPN
jgi:7-cyano-7-deazaguanine synthase